MHCSGLGGRPGIHCARLIVLGNRLYDIRRHIDYALYTSLLATEDFRVVNMHDITDGASLYHEQIPLSIGRTESKQHNLLEGSWNDYH